ncbi:MAG: phosphoribosylglycinamide formyltransferase [Bacteroidetes bacterium]|nr:MAG: phosphoribosylglycinamide formyltransferase [Bacteroidota bacterium]
MNKKVYKIAIFASGSGTNAENMIRYFKGHDFIEVAVVVSNNPDAYALKRAEKENVPAVVMDKSFRNSEERVMELMRQFDIHFIVLAGYLLLIPQWLTRQFEKRIVNIHPALLPHFGGKGMYGDHVHEAVIKSGEKKSGITIHYVNEKYDQGDIIFQAECPVLSDDTPQSLAKRIHELEYRHFPPIVEKIILE